MRDKLSVCSLLLILFIGWTLFASPALANVGANPSSINFGSITINSHSASTTIVLTNASPRPTTIEKVSSSLPQFIVTGPSLPLILQNHQSVSFQVVFDPNAASTVSGTVTFTLARRSTGSLVVPVTGTGVAPPVSTYLLSPSSTSISFPNTLIGSSSSQSLTLSNTGNSSVTVSQISLSGAGFTDSGIALPFSLSAGQNVSLSVAFSPTVAGASTGSIIIISNATNSSLAIPLSAAGVQPQLTVAPATVNFGSIATGVTNTQTITVNNSGTANLVVTQASVIGSGFSNSGISLPLTVSPGASSSFTLSFTPTSACTCSGTLTLVSNALTSSLNVALSGTGVAPKTYLLSPGSPSLSFANTIVGSSSSQSLVLSNTGNSSVTISQISVTGAGFSGSGVTLPATVNAGQSISLAIAFSPTLTGSSSGSITVLSNATNSPATISLSATGVQPQIAVLPTSVSFGSVTTGTTNTQTVTVQNSGNASLTITQASVIGSGFTESGVSLPLTLAPGASSAFTLSFTPVTASTVSGTLTLASNASIPSLNVPLSGTGLPQVLQLSANSTSLRFGSQTLSTSASQTVTLTNTGNSSVTISQLSVTGTAFSFSGFTAPLTVAPGQSTTFSVIFDPTTAGNFSGTASIVSNATNSPQSIALSGVGAAPVTHSVTLSWQPSTSSVVGYNVYEATTSGGPYTKMTSSPTPSTIFSDTSVTSGDTYYFVTTAVDSSGDESTYSNQAVAVIP
jgi:hypothetical protein